MEQPQLTQLHQAPVAETGFQSAATDNDPLIDQQLSQEFQAPADDQQLSQDFQAPADDRQLSQEFQAPANDQQLSQEFQAPADDQQLSQEFQAPANDQQLSQAFQAPADDQQLSQDFQAPADDQQLSQDFQAPADDQQLSQDFQAPADDQQLSQDFQAPADDQQLSQEFQAPAADQQLSQDFQAPADDQQLSQEFQAPKADLKLNQEFKAPKANPQFKQELVIQAPKVKLQFSENAQKYSNINRQFNEECLASHSEYRGLHGCQPLRLSAKLSARAQAWAEHLAALGYLMHSPSAAGSFGENVAMKSAQGSQEYTGAQASAQWYSEIAFYSFDGQENQSRCGHFSQLVWKGSRKAGFGKAVSADGKMFAVGHYLPPGNAMNKWVANVPPPISGQIKVPSQADIMGADQTRAASKKVTSTLSLVDAENPAGRLLLAANRRFGDYGGLAPKPREALDRQVARSVKVRIINGEKSLTVRLTFMRPDASRYQLTNRVILDNDIAPPLPSNGSRSSDANPDALSNRGGFAAEMLAAHNEIRQRHLAPHLARSESLEALAQTWSERLAAEGRLRHCDLPEDQVGQSVARLSADRLAHGEAGRLAAGPAALLARQWYQERSGYLHGSVNARLLDEVPDPGINGGHFTQMVWRSTEELGVGCTVDEATGDLFAVCLYRPGGNIADQFAENVFPASS